MKNKDLFRFKTGLDTVSKIKGVKFAYAVIKNKKLVTDEIEILENSVEISDEYREYDQKRITLCEKFVDRDEDGNMITANNTYVITYNKESFDTEFNQLKTDYLKTITERESQLVEYEKLLNEETTIEDKLMKVSFDDLPQDITADELEEIIEMIN